MTILGLGGNHDRILSMAAVSHTAAWFRSSSDVSVDILTAPRKYETFGDHLLMFTHGDLKRTQQRKLNQIIVAEAREKLGRTRYTSTYTGHYHTQSSSIDDTGTLQFAAPGPADTDAWHDISGYVGSMKQLQSVLLEPYSTDVTILNETV